MWNIILTYLLEKNKSFGEINSSRNTDDAKLFSENHGFEKFSILRGMRIAQIIFLKLPEIEIVESQKLSKTERNDGGFGSTGIWI